MKNKPLIPLIVLVLIAVFCGSGPAPQDSAYEETAVSFPSRGVEVPAVVTLPAAGEASQFVVLVHGHGGNKDENIGFPAIARELAKRGIGSIRMDFPGCGESGEEFAMNTQSNMKANVLAAVDFVTDSYSPNPDAIGIFGYSMGGRIALELIADRAYIFLGAALLAPAADTDDLKNLFGGEDGWEDLKETANTSPEGYAPFTTIYGQEQQLSKEWFADLEKYPGNTLIDAAANQYAGPSLVVYAVDDEAVSPSVSQTVAEKFGAQRVVIPEDGHSYGFYSDKTEILNMVASAVADFFANL